MPGPCFPTVGNPGESAPLPRDLQSSRYRHAICTSSAAMRQLTFAIALATCLLLAAGPVPAKERAGPGGRQLYLENCARCHGLQRRGDGADAPFFLPRPRDLSTGFAKRYAPDELVARVRDGTPLSLAIDPEGRAARARTVENILAHLERLPDIDWKTVDAGGALYGRRCEVCHGQFGQPWPRIDLPNGVQAPPRDLRSPEYQSSVSDAELIQAFRHGKAGMPAVPPALSPDESRQLAAFVRVLSPGFEAYSFYCAPCHGDDGRGRGILLRKDERPHVVLDRAYLTGKTPEELRAAVSHMMDEGGGGMPHFKDVLDDGTLRVIVEYLQNSP